MKTTRAGVAAGVVWMLVGAAGLCVSSAAMAQAAGDKDALQGPKVKDQSLPGQRRTLTGKGDPKMDRAGRLAPRMFERAMGVLRADDASENLKLTEAQDTHVKAIRAEFMGQMKDYLAEHRSEVSDLREKLPPRERGRIDQFLNPERGQGGPGGPAGRGGKGRPDGAGPTGQPPAQRDGDMQDDGMEPMVDEAEATAAKERLKEIMEGAPKPADAQARVMAILTEAQRAAVTTEIERIQKEQSERSSAGKPGAGKPNDAKPGEGKPQEGERPEGDGQGREELLKLLTPEEREKLKTMTPEERRAFIRGKAGDRAKKPGK